MGAEDSATAPLGPLAAAAGPLLASVISAGASLGRDVRSSMINLRCANLEAPMSALGQKRTFWPSFAMSPKSGHSFSAQRCPLSGARYLRRSGETDTGAPRVRRGKAAWN